MIQLDSIKTGKESIPPRIMLYGTEGVGKSTFAAQAPAPIFIQTEDGLAQIGADRFPLATTLRDVMEALTALYTQEHKYQTVVIDSLDWLERMVWDEVCSDQGVKTIEKASGGYGKGYADATAKFRTMTAALDAMRAKKGMACIMIAHSKVEKFEDPEEGVYDRYSPRLHKGASALLTEWADVVAFASRRLIVQQADDGATRARPVGKDGGERVLRCVGGPACVAKNRYNMPMEMPLLWSAFAAALSGEKANGKS